MDKVIVAAVQASPIFLDREATVEKASSLIKEAAGQGAKIIAFPETFIPTYPDWVWRTTPWSDGGRLFGILLENSVVVPSAATDEIGRAAKAAKAYVVMGINEREERGSTVFNTAVYFSPDGELLGKHRKLMPTGGERLVWGMGDGSTMPVFDTPFGRLGGLICWENYMPLARFAMYTKGIDIWVAPTWDTGDSWVATLRHIAKEGRMHVIGVAPVLRRSDVPDDIPNRESIYGTGDDWLWNGYSAITGPRGEILAGPLIKEEGILYAEVDSDRARSSRVQFDPTGHYSRPDVFQLHVDETPRPVAQFEGEAAESRPAKRKANSRDGADTRAKPQSPVKRTSTRSTK